MKNSRQVRQRSSVRQSARRGFLGLERLEERAVFSGASPMAVNDLFQTMIDQPLEVSTPGILANDTDAEGDALTASLFSGPAHGTLSLNGDGSFQYTPESGFKGLDSFMYTASDGTSSSMLAAVTLSVGEGEAPVSADDAYTLNENGVLDIPGSAGVLANDSDANSDPLTASLVTGPEHGTLTLAEDGSFSYTPEANFQGTDTFSYVASDGSLSSKAATVTITVNPVNNAPVAENDAFTTDEDSPLHITAENSVLTNDHDADGDAIAPTVLSQPLHGSLTLNADGSFDYTPFQDFNGVDGFSYTLSDGTATSNVATVTIQVAAVNDAPSSKADEYVTDEDKPLVIDTAGVLSNDSDIDGDPLTATVVTGPANGQVTMKPDGTFVYTPNQDFSGADSFTYVANDGTANGEETTVNITVNPVNDTPQAVNDEFSLAEDGVLTVDAAGVLTNDVDADGDSMTAELVSPPLHGTVTLNRDGSFVYTPAAEFNGVDGFGYQISDGSATSAVAAVTINVIAVNDAPVAGDDSFTTDEDQPLAVDPAGVLANDADVDGDALTPSLVAGPANGTVTLNADGSFVYTPNTNFFGADSFTYSVTDGTATSQATVAITVNSVSDAPTSLDDAYSLGEDQTLKIGSDLGVLANDVDGEGRALSAEIVTQPKHGTVTLNADGSFTYQPEANYFGSDSFTYAANNGVEAGAETTVALTVESLNDTPVAANDDYSFTGGTFDATAAQGVVANDTDIDSSALQARLVAPPQHGTVTLNADGSFNYAANDGYTGDDSFRYQVSDGMANSNVATVSLHIAPPVITTPENHRPTAGNDQFVAAAGQSLTIGGPGVLANDADADGDSLTASLFSGPQHGTVALNGDGSFVYTPNAGFSGQDSFLYRVSDGTENSPLAAVTISVRPGDPPSVITCGRGADGLTTIIRRTRMTMALAAEGANVLADRLEELGDRVSDKVHAAANDLLASLDQAREHQAARFDAVDSIFAHHWWRR